MRTLFFQLLSAQLGLAIPKLGTILISFGDTVPDGDVGVQPNIVIGEELLNAYFSQCSREINRHA